MKSRYGRGWALAWLLAPALAAGACGETSSGGDQSSAGSGASAGGGAGGSGNGTAGSTPSRGGSMMTEPMPVSGMAGRGGSEPLSNDSGAGPGPMLPPGISDKPSTAMCAANKCSSASVGPIFIDPCCAGDECGLETGFLALVGANFADTCQPKGQPGELDDTCPTSPSALIPFPLGGQTIMVPVNGNAGCCREDGRCGVLVNDIVSPLLGKVASLGLGCVDSAPFFGNAAAPLCGAGGAGGGGGPGPQGGAGSGPGPSAQGGAAGSP